MKMLKVNYESASPPIVTFGALEVLCVFKSDGLRDIYMKIATIFTDSPSYNAVNMRTGMPIQIGKLRKCIAVEAELTVKVFNNA
jgi:hypothetical protein